MKSIKTLAYMGAIALLSVGLMSCHKDEPENNFTDANGNYKGETVKTQFMINIAQNVSSTKRFMQGNDIQADVNNGIGAFQGMKNITLVPYAGAYDYRIGKNIELDDITTTIGIGSGQLNAANSIYYTDISIPLGTQKFLFYATSAILADNDVTRHQYGAVAVNGLYQESNEKDGITFDLVKIYPTATTPSQATALAEYLTAIANAADVAEGGKSWSNCGNSAIEDLYIHFIDMKAGSSSSILSLVTDLYNTLDLFHSTQVPSTSGKKNIVDDAVLAVMDSIKTKASVTYNADTKKYVLKLSSDDDFDNYPANINLPDGVAQVKWDDNNNEFNVINDPNSIAIGGLETTSLNNFVYPASLQYFIQSGIETSTKTHADLYNGENDWATILDAYKNGGEVKSATRSVAIHDDIQYGVGQLRTNVKLGTTTFYDYLDDELTITEDASNANLTWTALLIGGQQSVGYDFTVESYKGESGVYTIYDNKMPVDNGVLLKQTTSPTNYTLVFSTEDGAEEIVHIALELVNNAETFYGYDGQIIPKGSKFYLVGELDATTATLPQEGYREENNIFYKDYVTTVNLTINNQALKKAYNTIPDLRSEKLELGFSVDLEWQAGLSFDVTL